MAFTKRSVCCWTSRSELKVKSCQTFLLPPAVVGFDRGLKAILARREHGSHSQLQTHLRDTTKDIGIPMRTLKHGVVVERHVARTTMLPPMQLQRFQHGIRGPAGFHEAVG